jgi:hypothetical protein
MVAINNYQRTVSAKKKLTSFFKTNIRYLPEQKRLCGAVAGNLEHPKKQVEALFYSIPVLVRNNIKKNTLIST